MTDNDTDVTLALFRKLSTSAIESPEKSKQKTMNIIKHI